MSQKPLHRYLASIVAAVLVVIAVVFFLWPRPMTPAWMGREFQLDSFAVNVYAKCLKSDSPSSDAFREALKLIEEEESFWSTFVWDSKVPVDNEEFVFIANKGDVIETVYVLLRSDQKAFQVTNKGRHQADAKMVDSLLKRGDYEVVCRVVQKPWDEETDAATPPKWFHLFMQRPLGDAANKSWPQGPALPGHLRCFCTILTFPYNEYVI